MPDEVKKLVRENAPKAFKKIVKLMNSKDDRVALQAANCVLDRAFGKPSQAVHHLGADGGAVEVDAGGQLLEMLRNMATNGKANGHDNDEEEGQ